MKKEYNITKAKPLRELNLPPAEEVDRHTKVKVSLYMDNDVLKWFKGRSEKPAGDAYKVLINQALREYMGAKQKEGPALKDDLLQDEDFLSRLAERLKHVG